MRAGLLVVAAPLASAAAQAAPTAALDRCLASEAGATTMGQIQCVGALERAGELAAYPDR